MRPLHSRLRRHSPQLGAGPTRQGISGRHRLRQQSADGRVVLRFLRRVHGVLPHRRADQQEGCRNRTGRAMTSSIRPNFCSLPIFKNVSGTFLELNQNAMVEATLSRGRDHLPRGRIWLHGFYILEGKAEVILSSPIAHVKTEGSGTRILQQAEEHAARRREEDQREARSLPAYHSHRRVGRSAVRQSDRRARPRRPVRRDDLHELYPRSATVRAKTDCVMLEMLRNVLDIMQRNKTFRAQLERNYRKRALDSHLRSVPMLRAARPRSSSTTCAIVWN